MNTEQARKEVIRIEEKLKGFIIERDKLAEMLEAQARAIEETKDHYVDGNEKAKPRLKDEIKKLEARREEDVWRLRRIEKKAVEAEGALNEAQTNLRQAESKREEQCTEYIAEQMNADSDNLFSSVEPLAQKTISLLIEGQLAWGELCRAESILRIRRDGRASTLFDRLSKFDGEVVEGMKKAGLVQLGSFTRGFPARPSLVNSAGLGRDAQVHAERMNKEKVEAFKAEFLNGKEK